MPTRGLVGADGWLTAAGRQTKERVETLTDELAAPAYDVLEPDELDQLVEDLTARCSPRRCRFSVDRRRSTGNVVQWLRLRSW